MLNTRNFSPWQRMGRTKGNLTRVKEDESSDLFINDLPKFELLT